MEMKTTVVLSNCWKPFENPHSEKTHQLTVGARDDGVLDRFFFRLFENEKKTYSKIDCRRNGYNKMRINHNDYAATSE